MLVAIISLMVYAMIPFRGVHGTRTPGGPAGAPVQTLVTASEHHTPCSVTVSAGPAAGAVKAAVTHTKTVPAKDSTAKTNKSG